MSTLPYNDAKPVGAADFYFVNNATFRHIRDTYGEDALRAFWRDLGRDYQQPVWEQWRAGGLPAVAEYQRDFFAAEPGGEVEVVEGVDEVVIDVRSCPAISHLRAHDRDIVESFCQHCFVMGDATAEQAGLALRVVGGNGRCRQRITAREGTEPQDLSDIESCGGA